MLQTLQFEENIPVIHDRFMWFVDESRNRFVNVLIFLGAFLSLCFEIIAFQNKIYWILYWKVIFLIKLSTMMSFMLLSYCHFFLKLFWNSQRFYDFVYAISWLCESCGADSNIFTTCIKSVNNESKHRDSGTQIMC